MFYFQDRLARTLSTRCANVVVTPASPEKTESTATLEHDTQPQAAQDVLARHLLRAVGREVFMIIIVETKVFFKKNEMFEIISFVVEIQKKKTTDVT